MLGRAEFGRATRHRHRQDSVHVAHCPGTPGIPAGAPSPGFSLTFHGRHLVSPTSGHSSPGTSSLSMTTSGVYSEQQGQSPLLSWGQPQLGLALSTSTLSLGHALVSPPGAHPAGQVLGTSREDVRQAGWHRAAGHLTRHLSDSEVLAWADLLATPFSAPWILQRTKMKLKGPLLHPEGPCRHPHGKSPRQDSL